MASQKKTILIDGKQYIVSDLKQRISQPLVKYGITSVE